MAEDLADTVVPHDALMRRVARRDGEALTVLVGRHYRVVSRSREQPRASRAIVAVRAYKLRFSREKSC